MAERRRNIPILASAAAIVVCIVWAGWMALNVPSWWEAALSCSGTESSDRARALEAAFASVVHRVRADGERWAVEVTQTDINAWLACRAPEWQEFDNSIPDLAMIMLHRVEFRPGVLTIARSEAGFLVSVSAEPTIAGGSIRLQVLGSSVGNLRIPSALVSTDTSVLEDSVSGALVAPLSDGRRVELVDLEIREGSVALAFRTHFPKP